MKKIVKSTENGNIFLFSSIWRVALIQSPYYLQWWIDIVQTLLKLQQLFFLEIGIKWNLKRPQRPEEVLSNKHKDKGIMLPDLKIDHKAIGANQHDTDIKKKRHINQGSRRSGPERNRSVCFALTDWPFSAQNIQWRKYGLFKTCYWETQMLAC